MARNSGIRWRGDDFANFRNVIGKMSDEFTADLYDTLKEVGENAERNMKHRVASSGTMTNPQGRYETWKMHDAITHTVTTTAKGGTLRIGWPEGAPPYTMFQDLGTRELHGRRVDPMNKGGVGIPAMLALLDTFVEARAEMWSRGLGSQR